MGANFARPNNTAIYLLVLPLAAHVVRSVEFLLAKTSLVLGDAAAAAAICVGRTLAGGANNSDNSSSYSHPHPVLDAWREMFCVNTSSNLQLNGVGGEGGALDEIVGGRRRDSVVDEQYN